MAKKSKPASQAETEVFGVDLPEIERLLDFMQKHNLEEFEYERNGLHIRLKKPSHFAPATATAAPSAAHPHFAPAAAAESHAAAAAAPAHAAREASVPENVHVIKSPIVGTFYASPSPEAAAFVALGSRVEAGQVLCIIEAMKLMNEIEADVAGEISRIFVENGHPVEYGEPLFGITPHRKK
ncbi:MAG TPA: acetyl-CoA carboxylase biotin carboxyl carrier protein [Candidatus Acidoferrales bacterium]|nr:acetyl-CoA carboxylase biotin carboxyl carrier protein [Candidatus Acidoferrales bacterium]